MTISLEFDLAMNHTITREEDFEWVDRFVAGDEIAFTNLVNKYRRLVYSIAYRFVNNHPEADDITQETFIKAYHHLKRFRKESSFKTWLIRIVSNLSINVKKSSRIVMDTGLDPQDMDHGIQAEGLESLLSAERHAELRAAIAKLPKKQKQTLLLRTFRDMSCKEVADTMKCSTGTVKANLFNAIKNLKTYLGGT